MWGTQRERGREREAVEEEEEQPAIGETGAKRRGVWGYWCSVTGKVARVDCGLSQQGL